MQLQLTTSRYTLGPCLDDADNYSHAAAIGVVCGVVGFILLLILIWGLWYKGCFSRRGVRTATAYAPCLTCLCLPIYPGCCAHACLAPTLAAPTSCYVLRWAASVLWTWPSPEPALACCCMGLLATRLWCETVLSCLGSGQVLCLHAAPVPPSC